MQRDEREVLDAGPDKRGAVRGDRFRRFAKQLQHDRQVVRPEAVEHVFVGAYFPEVEPLRRDAADRTELVARHLEQDLDGGVVSHQVPDLQDHAVSLDSARRTTGDLGIQGQRLFHEHVAPARSHRLNKFGVARGIRRDEDRIEVVARQQLPLVRVNGDAGVPDRRFGAAGFGGVADRDEACAGRRCGDARHVAAPHPITETAQTNHRSSLSGAGHARVTRGPLPVLPVPLRGAGQTVDNRGPRTIPEHLLRLRRVGQRMADVAGTRLLVLRLDLLAEDVVDHVDQPVDRDAAAGRRC